VKAETSTVSSNESADNGSSAPDGDNYAFNLSRPADSSAKKGEGADNSEQPAKESATAAAPDTGSSSSSSQDTMEIAEKIGDSSLAEAKEPEAPEAVNTLVSNGLAESKGLSL
jgi:hypothetical protein